jgi:hypothetical protein
LPVASLFVITTAFTTPRAGRNRVLARMRPARLRFSPTLAWRLRERFGFLLSS